MEQNVPVNLNMMREKAQRINPMCSVNYRLEQLTFALSAGHKQTLWIKLN